jgi:hydroxylamine reductase
VSTEATQFIPIKEEIMFCYQCEQAATGGCTKFGICGKDPKVAALQDLLVYSLKGLSLYAVSARKAGKVHAEVNRFTAKALFSTLTNVDFDPDRFAPMIRKAVELRERMRAESKENFSHPAAVFTPAETIDGLVKQGEEAMEKKEATGPKADVQSLQDILLYGLKGVAAYADHAEILGKTDEAVYAFMHEALAAMTRTDIELNDWIGLVLKCGEVNLKAMEILDAGNTGTYGHPVPTRVPLGAKKGKAILVSGHDLKDLESLLKQTEGKGIYIYTHGEMLPTHGYPELKKYKHFYGHYGTAWQNQQKEFADFPGAVVMTTNCIQRPLDSYKNNMFTSGLVGWPGIPHITDNDFTPAITRALELPGFEKDVPAQEVVVGFARNSVLSVAGKIVEAVKDRKIRHFFLVGGCDGARPGRNYYSDFVEKAPKDTVVLTLACGKFRFFDKDLGDISGIPRLLDIGQCNDAYSAIEIALALSKAFNLGVNELPLSLVLSWYEQKAVAILLTLLHLGIKDIRLGPTLPAFITPNVLAVLVKNFGIRPIAANAEEDLEEILGACWNKTAEECAAEETVSA